MNAASVAGEIARRAPLLPLNLNGLKRAFAIKRGLAVAELARTVIAPALHDTVGREGAGVNDSGADRPDLFEVLDANG